MRTEPIYAGIAKAMVRTALWFCASNLLLAVLAAQCLPPILVVPNGTFTSGDQSAADNNALSAANFVISGSATATFVAGNCIELGTGFRATAGTAPTTFHAWVETAPANVSVSPASGFGLTRLFTWTVSSPSGYTNLSEVQALFNTSDSTVNGCYIQFLQASHLLSVADNSGAPWLGGLVPGSSGTAGNSYCSIDASASSFSNSGTQLTLTVSVTFKTALSGSMNDYLIAYDNEGLDSTRQQMGTWTVPAPPETIATPAVTGPPTGNTGASYPYTASGGVSSLGHAVQYQFIWDNVPSSVWLTPGITTALKTWTTTGPHSTTVQARCATDTSVTSQTSTAATATFQAPSPSILTLTSTHSGPFTQGQQSATYTVTASNQAGAGPTVGVVTVTETVTAGLVPVLMAGNGWTCGLTTCTRGDALSAGSLYPAIIVTMNVASNAPSQVTNLVTVSGGGSASAVASDLTTVEVLLRYSNPLAFATSASVVGGVPTTLTVTYTSDNGPTDIASGQVKIDDCYLAWSRSGNLLLYGANGGGPASGILGSSSTPISAGNCSINLANSYLSTPTANPKALVLTLAITFPEQAYPSTDDRNPSPEFVGTHKVYAWGTSVEGLPTGQVDLGSLVVSQGPDFTLTTVGANESVSLGTNATLNLTVAAAGLNGFIGSIALGIQGIAGAPCFLFIGNTPTSILANTQATITVKNNNCTPGAFLVFTLHGSANGIRRGTSAISIMATDNGDFSVGVGTPSRAVLPPQSSVSFPVTVSSVNGQIGNVSLSLDPYGIPAGVSSSFSASQVYLSGSGSTATISLTLYSSASIPPGTYPFQVVGRLGGTQHTARFSLSTQVTTFQVTSATGSAIVHNTGQEVQVTHNVPAGYAPAYTTCDTLDPKVTCRVISSYPGTVTLGITASNSAVHGTRVLSLNGGATTVHAAIANSFGQNANSGIKVQAGGYASGWLSIYGTECEYDGYCGEYEVDNGAYWIHGSGSDSQVYVFVDPPLDTAPDTYVYS